LRISHTAALATYRARERALVEKFPVDLQVVIPKHWQHLGAEEAHDDTEPFVVHRIQTIGTGNIPLFAFAPLPLIRIMRDFRPDVIDIHEEPYSISGFEIVALAKKYAPQAAMLFYTAQNLHKNYPPPFKWTERYVYDACVAAYPCSSQAEEVLIQKGFAGLTSVLPLGVDPAKFNSTPELKAQALHRRETLRLDGFVLGYFGRIEIYKGIQYLFEAVSQLAGMVNCKIVIAGSGTYKSRLQMLSARLDIDDQIHWVGERAAGEINEWMALCDAIVIPSLTTQSWKEQFGRVAAEAMACGVPVVVSDSGSLPEVVRSAGMIVPEADSIQLKTMIMRLAGDDRLRESLGSAGVALVRDKYHWSKVAERTFELYCQIIEGPSQMRSMRYVGRDSAALPK